MRQFSHLHAVLDNFAFPFEGETRSGFVDPHDSQIDFRSKPAIQFNLTFAKIPAFFQCAEIEKAEIHRLLHFKDERRRNEHPRNVGLNRAHRIRPVWIRTRQSKESNKLLLELGSVHQPFSRHERIPINLKSQADGAKFKK